MDLMPRANLLYSENCRDEKARLFFRRYRGLRGLAAPNAGSFSAQINLAAVDQVVRSGGAVILYQHFGVREKRADGTFVENTGPRFFSDEAMAVWDRIASYARAGMLWVPRVSDLLDFENLKNRTSAVWKSIDLVVSGPEFSELRRLEGLWFKIKQRPARVLFESVSGTDVREVPFKCLSREEDLVLVLGKVE